VRGGIIVAGALAMALNKRLRAERLQAGAGGLEALA